MNRANAAAAYARLYAPTVAELRQSLPGMAEGLHAQLMALYYAHPTAHDCDSVAANLSGAARAVLRLGEALHRESGSNA